MQPKRKRFSFAGKISLQVILVVGAILTANLFAQRIEFEWDMTEGKIHSLSDQSQQVLAQLTEPVRVLVFANQQSEAADHLLNRFDRASDMISYKLIRPVDQPQIAEQYEVEGDGVVIVECGEKRRRLPQLLEQTLVTAIVQVSRGAGKTVVFATGHGERDTGDATPEGYNRAKRVLIDAGYTVEQRELTDEAISDAAAVIIAGPQQAYGDATVARLHTFVENGGGLMVLLDPPPAAGLTNVLSPYGILPAEDFVIELHKGFRHPQYGAHTHYVRAFHGEHPVGQRMNQPALLQFVRSIQINDELSESEQPIGLCVSSPNSWGERNVEQRERITWDEGVDPPGPRFLAAATPPTAPIEGRVMVIGTSRFAENRQLNMLGNRELFEKSIGWLTDELDAPMIEARGVERKLEVSDAQLRQMLVVCVLVIPAVMAGMGLFVFIRRAR